MATVENKVVSLEFNNKRFQGNVASTMSALDKLKAKLSFGNAGKGFADINSAANKVNLTGMASAIDQINNKFSAMGAVAFTAIQGIVRTVANGAKQIAGAITGPVFQGGFARAMNIEQARFQLEGLDADVDAVMESTLAAVKGTAYGLDEAAKTAAVFTASGIEAGEDMTAALRGITGAAGMTGASFKDIAYVYQGIAGTGKVTQQDFLQFGTRGLNVAAALAKEFGKTEQEVRDMASNGEISFDMFSKAMDSAFGAHAQKANQTFQGALANTKAALARVGAAFLGEAGGGLTNARDIFNGLTVVVDKVNTALKPVVDVFKLLTTYAKQEILKKFFTFDAEKLTKVMPHIAKAIYNVVTAIMLFIKPIREAFREIFPKSTVKSAEAFAKGIADFTEKLRIGGNTANFIKGVFKVFFGVLKVGIGLVLGIAKAVGSFVGALAGTTGFQTFFQAIGDLFGTLASGAGGAASGAMEALAAGAKALGTFLGNLIPDVTGFTGAIQEAYNILAKGDFTGVGPWAEDSAIVDKLFNIREAIVGFFDAFRGGGDSADEAEKKTSKFAGAIQFVKDVLGGIGTFFSDLLGGVTSFGEAIGNVGAAILRGLGAIGSGLTDALSSAFSGGNINWNTVIGGIGVGAGAALLLQIRKFLQGIDPKTYLDQFTEGIRGVLDSASNALNSFALSVKADAIKKIAVSIAILAVSMLLLASINPGRLAQAGAAMAGMFGAVEASLYGLSKMNFDAFDGAAIAATMLALAASIFILSAAMKKLSDLDRGDIIGGLASIRILMSGIANAADTLKSDTGTLAKAGLAMIGMAVSVYILTFALARLASIDAGKAIAGSIGAGIAMLGMAKALQMVNEKEAAQKGLAFTLVATSVRIFAAAVESFGQMPITTMIRGFAAIGVGLFGMTKFLNALPTNLLQIGFQILLISGAMLVMSEAVARFGEMGFGTMIQGLIGVAGGLMIMAIAAQFMTTAIVGAGAILLVSVALIALATAVGLFGQMGVDTMIKSILGIAAALLVIGVAAALLGYIAPLVLAAGAAFLVLGAGMFLFGAGAWLAATAIVALAAAGLAGATVAVGALLILAAALPAILGLFIKGFSESLPQMIELGVKLVLALLDGLMQVLPRIFEVIGEFLDGLIPLLLTKGPALILAGILLVKTFLIGILNALPDIYRAGLEAIAGFLEAIRDNAADLATLGLEAIGEFIRGILEGLPGFAESVANGIIEFLEGLAEVIREKSQEIGDAGRELGLAIIEGMINVFLPESLQEAIGNMINGMIDFFKGLLGISSPSSVFMEFGGDILQGLLNGLTGAVGGILNFFGELPGKIASFVGSVVTTLVQKGRDLLTGLWNGAKAVWTTVIGWVGGLIGAVVRTIGNVASTLTEKGRSLINGLWNGAKAIWTTVTGWVGGLAGKARDALTMSASTLLEKGKALVRGIKDGAVAAWAAVRDYIAGLKDKAYNALGNVRDKFRDIGRNILEGIKSGISNGWSAFTGWVKGKVTSIPGMVGGWLGIGSPAKTMIPIGKHTVEGIQVGLANQFPKLYGDIEDGTKRLQEAMMQGLNALPALADMNPTITPVLDLSLVERDAQTLGELLGIESLATDLAYQNAQDIATTTDEVGGSTPQIVENSTTVNLSPTYNSPKALSMGDIYRGQKSQIALARRELGLAG